MGWEYVIRVVVTAGIVVGVTELAKRSSFWGAVLASLPLTSLLAFVWLYHDTGDVKNVARLSRSIFWLVIPSLALFVVLPVLLRTWSFWPSFVVSCLATVAAYGVLVWILRYFQITL